MKNSEASGSFLCALRALKNSPDIVIFFDFLFFLKQLRAYFSTEPVQALGSNANQPQYLGSEQKDRDSS